VGAKARENGAAPPQICGLARAKDIDIQRCGEAVKPAKDGRIHTFIATSPIHMENKLRMAPDQVLEQAVHAVQRARQFTDDVEFSPEDAGRSELDFLCRVLEAVIDAGARTLNIPDTVGYAVPHQFGSLIAQLRERIPNSDKAVFSVHCHNDLGLAVANSLAAVRNGARQVECTINGLGERAGNAALEEIVMAVRTRQDHFECDTGLDTTQIVSCSRLVSGITGFPVQPNKAIVGANAFAHESGIHQDGVLKEASTYEIMTPSTVGLKKSSLPLGKLSGRNAFRTKLQEMGYYLNDDELNRVFLRFKDLADRKRTVFDEDLVSLIETEVIYKSVPEHFRLEELVVLTGTTVKPNATVKLKVGDDLKTTSSFGDGPIDAAYKAITTLAQSKCKLLKFAVSSITGGTEALGEVSVRLEDGGSIVTGQGVDPDVVTASARAYINGLNRLKFAQEMGPKLGKPEEL